MVGKGMTLDADTSSASDDGDDALILRIQKDHTN
jgi:hypothetical protein